QPASEDLRPQPGVQARIFWGVGGFRVRVRLSKRVVQRPTHWRTVRDFCDRPIKRSFASSTRLYQDTDRLCLRISGECFGSAKNWAKPFMRATLACAYQSLISGHIRPVASRPLLSQTRLVRELVQIVVWADLSLFSA